MFRKVGHFIDGAEVDSESGDVFETRDPATGDTLAEVALASRADVEMAVEAAERSFEAGVWRNLGPSDRSARLRATAATIRAQCGILADIESADSGKPLRFARQDIIDAADLLDWAASLCGQEQGKTYPESRGCFIHSRREPYGVVGSIAPWNFPLLLAAWKSAPALAVGNSVVLKMAEQTPLSTMALAKIYSDCGIPPGVLNVVHGDGSVGEMLVDDPRVRKVTFTGSTATGQRILERSAPHVRSVHLELGGKTPNIVFSDANLEDALRGALYTAFFHSGQVCTAGSRLLVQEAIADEFIDRLTSSMSALRVGPTIDPTTQIGPLVSAEQRERVETYIHSGLECGAQLRSGGARPSAPSLREGYYVMPTLFDRVTSDMPIAREEIFGPVLTVIRFKDDDDALAIANDTTYGLAASVWTRSLDRSMRMMDDLDVGMVWTNCVNRGSWRVPYEGHKMSGMGEDRGNEVTQEFTQMKVGYVQYAGAIPSL